MASDIDGSTSVAEIVKRCPSTRRIFDAHGLKGCGGEHGPTEPLSFFAAVHGADLDELVQALRDEMTHPDTMAPAYRPGLEDFIYRRFFRAGIVIVLSVGCLWGAINLLEISRAQTFLQLGLLSSIHAHAHAMIFGCAGRVVLQILTDFIPSTAYPLLGFTGFIELVALIWWGAELWKVMLGAPNGDIRGLLQSEVKLAQTD